MDVIVALKEIFPEGLTVDIDIIGMHIFHAARMFKQLQKSAGLFKTEDS